MARENIALMAHLMRRAGFGASRDELEARAANGDEATVEELLNPAAEPVDRYEFLRYQPGFWKPVTSPGMGRAAWFHTMLNTQRPLEEKMVLFLAPAIRYRPVENRPLARAHRPSRHVP